MADSAVSVGKNGVIKSIFCCPVVGENVEEGGDWWGGRTAPSTAGVASRLKGFPVLWCDRVEPGWRVYILFE